MDLTSVYGKYAEYSRTIISPNPDLERTLCRMNRKLGILNEDHNPELPPTGDAHDKLLPENCGEVQFVHNPATEEIREEISQMRTKLGLVLKHVTGGEENVNAVNYLSKPQPPTDEYYYEKDSYVVNDQTGNHGNNNDISGPYVPPQNREVSPRDGEGSMARVEDILQKMRRRFDISDEHTKELRSELACFGQTVDAHAISIKHLELQMAQLSLTVNPHKPGTLPSNTAQDPKNDGHYMTVTTRENVIRGDDDVVEVSGELEDKMWNEVEVYQKVTPMPRPPPPFPQMLVKKNEDVEKSSEVQIEESLGVEALEAVIMNFDSDYIEENKSLVAALDRGDVQFKPKKLELDMKHPESPPAKPSIDEASKLELKDLPPHLRYVFLGKSVTLPVIIGSNLNVHQVESLVEVLKRFKRAIDWTIEDIIGIPPYIWSHKIQLMPDHKPSIEHQRHLNPPMQEVVKKEIIKWLDVGLIYSIADSSWVCPVQCVPKKQGMTVVPNEKNAWTEKDHFPLTFMDQMLDRLAGKGWYCFLDGYSGYNQISIVPEDQEKTTFTCPYGTFAFKRMSFGLSILNRSCVDGIIRCCVPEVEMLSILEACHSSRVGGHHSGIRTSHKILQCGYYWQNIHQDAYEFAKTCDRCQRYGGISRKQKLPLNPILVFELFDVWGIDFMGSFVSSHGMKYILVAVEYVSKWVEAIALVNNEGKSVTAFLKKHKFSKFDTLRAIISDGGSLFCNKLFKGLLEKYGVRHNVTTPYHPHTSEQVEV
ncbi:uncharacterized protein [Solanum lycopersicum]|uniref:uncharacterized protein n=1 Tax=Solanum lycopersicum TaxID=4081 RepID=UPI00374810FE